MITLPEIKRVGLHDNLDNDQGIKDIVRAVNVYHLHTHKKKMSIALVNFIKANILCQLINIIKNS